MPTPVKTLIISETNYPDTGMVEFKFIHGNKTYRVLPKPGAGDKLEAYNRFVKHVCRSQGLSPFSYRGWKNYFDIERVDDAGTKKTTKDNPDAEQVSLKLARKMELISSELSDKGLVKVSEMLKPIALLFRRGWLGPKSVDFFEDLSNANIQPDDAMKVMDAYEGGVSDGPQMSQVTGLDTPVCGVVLALAKKHDLCPVLSDQGQPI